MIEAVNDGSVSVSSTVGIGHVLNPKDIAIYRTLAAGLQTADILHRSADTIGGKLAYLRSGFAYTSDGRTTDQMGIKPKAAVHTRMRLIQTESGRRIAFADKQKVKIILAKLRKPAKLGMRSRTRRSGAPRSVLVLRVDEDDPDHGAFTTAADLDQAVAFGLPHEDALKALTKNGAYIWAGASNSRQ